MLFVIPWGTHWIIGTTDTDWALDLAHPAASRSDIDYLLDHVNRLLATPLTHDDVEGVYAGLRPLLAGESEATSQLSREHAVVSPVAGLVMVAGGKYTTYRVMAKDAVDAVVHALPRKVPQSCTDTRAAGRRRGLRRGVEPARALAAEVRPARRADRAPAGPLRLAHRRAARAGARSDPELGEPLEGAPTYLRVEAVLRRAGTRARCTSTTS